MFIFSSNLRSKFHFLAMSFLQSGLDLRLNNRYFRIDLFKKKHRVLFEDDDLECNGVPYVVLSQKMYDCHHSVYSYFGVALYLP